MAKLIKSIFHTTERKKIRHEEPEDDKNFTPPLGERRKLSISRSGRMKQNNKKRNSLSLDVYNQGIETTEKRNGIDINNTQKQITIDSKPQEKNQRSQNAEKVTPEEEIDRAFEIIDKT